MNKIHVLDCTLRDGGYNNNWLFGYSNIKKIVENLTESQIDIIECGFLTEGHEYKLDATLFDRTDRLTAFRPQANQNSLYVMMINFGEYALDQIPDCEGQPIDGLRVAFHKNDRYEALEYCAGLAKKGYKVFIQPMVAVTYSDEEYIDLIKRSNAISPFAFYIVDSFGVMKRRDLMRLYYLVDHNLSDGIHIGYHAHNNLQLAYSNAQTLIDIKTNREIIIDSSVFGMGRGAGNLNTELLIEYLNDLYSSNYQVEPLLNIIDQTLNYIYQTKQWGYSLPQYLSAKYNCHPNYASYLDEKKTLTVEDISKIISRIDLEKRNGFDKKYIESLYTQYQSSEISTTDDTEQLAKLLVNREVVLIVPGASFRDELDQIKAYIQANKPVVISVNFVPEVIEIDFAFVSNHRRYEELGTYNSAQLITTSNIHRKDHTGYVLPYHGLLNSANPVQDNSTLLIAKFLTESGVRAINIAGLDGYSTDLEQNYYTSGMTLNFDKSLIEAKNKGIASVLEQYSKSTPIQWLTKVRNISINANS